MGTPLTRKGNRHAIRRVQLPQRPPPDTEAERRKNQRKINAWLKTHTITKLPPRGIPE